MASLISKVQITALAPERCLLRCVNIHGNQVEMQLPASQSRVQHFISGGDQRLIQDAFPDLTPDEREFILTGLDGDKWDELMEDARSDFYAQEHNNPIDLDPGKDLDTAF